jgi:signal transduction histidine kinase
MTIKRLLRIVALSSTAITISLSLIVTALARSQFELNQIIELTHTSRTAADDIRRHSEYMQQLCRQYIMTGDGWWLERYNLERDIRKGLAAAPDGEQSIWLERYASSGFTVEELALLGKHDRKLVSVSSIERDAIGSARTWFSGNQADGALERDYQAAVRMVFSDTYRAFFQLALNPLEDFVILVEQRNARLFMIHSRRTQRLLYITIVLALLGILWQFVLVIQLGKRIVNPLLNLQQVFHGAIDSNLTQRVNVIHDDEIGDLYLCYNTMIERIRAVMDQMLQEQKNRRIAEFNIMQSQINPHFLYNSLDTIVWMAEINDHEKVVRLATSLSAFFRISLSKGRECILLSEEINHVENYLSIQKIRYQDTLFYEIRRQRPDFSPSVPKLIIQPLVENAIYHGIKMKRGKGSILVTIGGTESVEISIEDDGAGMDAATLEGLRTMIRTNSLDSMPDSFGFFNTLRDCAIAMARNC